MVWKEVLEKIANGELYITSPFSEGAFIEYYYVVVNESERRGFFLAWCPESLKGIQATSVRVPPNLPFITISEFRDNVKVPEVKLMDLTK